MKIISKFQDYYDQHKCFSHCSDDFTYIRKTQEIEIPRIHSSMFFEYSGEHYKNHIKQFIIGFCGNYYLGYKSFNPNKHYLLSENQYEDIKYDTSIFADNLLKKSLKIHKSKLHYNSELKKVIKAKTVKAKLLGVSEYWRKVNTEHFNECKRRLEKLDLFTKYNTPTFICTHDTYQRSGILTNITINPILGDYKFFRAVEPHIAYQEIEMFLGNELMPRDNPDQITDSLVLAKNHGFNKYSFRKAPTKHKRKNK